VKLFRGGLVFKAHRLVYRTTLVSKVIKKKKEVAGSTAFISVRKMLRFPTLWRTAFISVRYHAVPSALKLRTGFSGYRDQSRGSRVAGRTAFISVRKMLRFPTLSNPWCVCH
jgi:hypothetical protein